MRRISVFGVLLLALALLSSACIRKVTVAVVLPSNESLSTDELIGRVSSYGEIRSFSAQAGVLVRNYFTGVDTKADEFPEANGAIRLQRPESIRMQVNAPVINSQVADMVSDGQSFRLAVYYPTDKRQFVYGTNLKDFERMAADEISRNKDPRLAQAGGLINMRPQHITDAFLIKSNPAADRTVMFREEVRQEERDDRPGKKGRMVVRTYSVLYVLDGKEGKGELRRKFWFDRTRKGTPLVRQQTFDNGSGKLGSDIWYSEWFNVPGAKWEWPGRVIVDRRNDGYRIELTLEKDTVEINSDLPVTTFVLENTKNLPELNLDAPRKSSTAQDRKPEPVLPVR